MWGDVTFSEKRFDQAFSVWANSTLGLLSYWWHSSRSQSSKARLTIRSAESFPVLDFRALSDDQLITAEEIFDEFRDKELQPAYLADADPNRALLDRRVICDLLGFDEQTYVQLSAASPPNGAPNPPSTAANPDPNDQSWWFSHRARRMTTDTLAKAVSM